MHQIFKRQKADDDLFEIWQFIAADSTIAADIWIDKLGKQLELIASQPLIGRARDELAAGLRSFPFGRYIVFYLAEPNSITIVRILHSARDVTLQMHWH